MRIGPPLVLGMIALFLAGSARSDGNPLLVATVGPGYTIGVTDAAGNHLDSTVEGHYTLLVHDLSPEHNFVLADEPTGLHLHVQTEVAFVGDQTFEIDLRPGRYAYACAPHFDVMNGRFTVFAAPSLPTTTPTTPIAMPLRATVTATGLSLSARRVPAGLYRLALADRSARRNFHLTGPNVNRSTTRAFVGTTSWTIKLGRGTYRFGSDPVLTGRLTVY